MKKLLLALAFLPVWMCVGTQDARASLAFVYLTSAGGGGGSGCLSAFSPTFFNNPSNWGAGGAQIGPDTTVHLCNTFTGAPGDQLLFTQGSGTSGHPITILFETGAKLTAPYWGEAAINIQNDFIVLDGGTNGLIENTDNGQGKMYAEASGGVNVLAVHDVTVKNLTISNICIHTTNTNGTACTRSNAIGIAHGVSNILITRDTLHDAEQVIVYIPSDGDSNVTLSWNTIYHFNWGVGAAINGPATSTGLTIENNDIYCSLAAVCNWDDADDNNHHNGLMLYPQNSDGFMTSTVIRNNWIHDINGHTTAGIYLNPSGGADLPSAKIYNNLFTTSAGQSGPANGQITVGVGVTDAGVYNNTAVGGGNRCFSGHDAPIFKNNLCTGQVYGGYLDSGYSGVVSDYNLYDSLTGGSGLFMALSGSPVSYATWLAAGFDANGRTGAPNLGTDFKLGAGSDAIGHGVNLTSLGITALNTGAPDTFGVSGACGTGCVARSGSAAWDIGAYPSGSVVSPTTTTTPPASGMLVQTKTMPPGTVGQSYSATLSATGGSPPYSWSGFSFPLGLTLSAAGVLSGTPTAAGTFAGSYQAKDAGGATALAILGTTIASVTPTCPPAAPRFVSSDTFRVITGGGKLSVRTSPSTTASVATYLTNGSIGSIVGGPFAGDWWKVSKGYVSGAYIRQ